MASPDIASLFGIPVPDSIANTDNQSQTLPLNLPDINPVAASHTYQEQSGKHKGAAGIGRDILGTLGDFLLTRLHMKPMYWPGQQDRKLNAAWQGHDEDPQAALDRVTDVDFNTGTKLRDQYTDNQRLQAAQESTAETRAARVATAQDLVEMKASGYASASLNTMKTWDEPKRKQFYPQLRNQIILAGKKYGADFSDLPEVYDASTAPILEGFISGAVPVATQRQQALKETQIAETIDHNNTTEKISQQNADTNSGRLVETGRHNLEGEDNNRIKTGLSGDKAAETKRHNLKTEGQGDTKIADTKQHRKATEPVERLQGGYRYRLVNGKWVNTGPVT